MLSLSSPLSRNRPSAFPPLPPACSPAASPWPTPTWIRKLVSRLAAASADRPAAGRRSAMSSPAPVTSGQVAALKSLGITKGITMRTLPIAGALATPAEIRALAKRSDVASIFWNAPLRYMDEEANALSSVTRMFQNPADYGRAIPFSGAGVTVEINDSGIDAHPRRPEVRHARGAEHRRALTNLRRLRHDAADHLCRRRAEHRLSSGHGTHCAGIVGGTGAQVQRPVSRRRPGAHAGRLRLGRGDLILDAVGGLDYAATNQFSYGAPIRVVSNSWGSSGTFDPLDPVSIATYELYKRGIVTVFAAGNDGPGEDTHNPYAQAPWSISVGASEKDAVLTVFSSRGKRGESGTFTMPDGKSWTYINEPTIVAPGVDIVSTRDLDRRAAAAGSAERRRHARSGVPAVLHAHERHLDGDAARRRHRRADARSQPAT